MSKPFHLAPRFNHLYRLWEDALQHENLPQFDRWLSEQFKKNSQFGSKDRKWYSEMLFAAVRFGYFASFAELASREQKTLPEILRTLEVKLSSATAILDSWRNMPPGRFFAWVRLRYEFSREIDGSLGTTEDLSPQLRASFEQLVEALAMPEPDSALSAALVLASVPLWYRPYLQERMHSSAWTTELWQTFLKRQTTRSPLWLRLNHADRLGEVLEELRSQEFEADESKGTILATGAKGIFATQAYRNGSFEIQDWASQAIGSQLQVRPGNLVWDCCAGGGGKTLQIASLLENRGAVYASDIRTYKLEEVKKRARRAGFYNVRCLPWNGEDLPAFPREVSNRGGFDWVLVDAPCSSSGTWRRNPDAKYRISAKSIENLQSLQRQLLQRAADAVRPGGQLVYATCSWIVQENEMIIKNFLESHPHFSMVSSELLGTPWQDADTMFAAVLKKN